MIGHERSVRRAIPLRHALVWLPVLLAPFSALFFDTWLTVQTRLNDYEVSTITGRMRETRDAIDRLKVETAARGTLEFLEEKAPDLGLVPASPSQIEVIVYSAAPAEPRSEPLSEYATASVEPLPGVQTAKTDVGVRP